MFTGWGASRSSPFPREDAVRPQVTDVQVTHAGTYHPHTRRRNKRGIMRQVCTRRSRKEGIVKRKGVVFVQRCALHSMSNGLKHFRFGPAGQRSPRLSSLHSQSRSCIFFTSRKADALEASLGSIPALARAFAWERATLSWCDRSGGGISGWRRSRWNQRTSANFGVPSSDTGKYKRGATRAGVGTTMCVPPLRIVFWQSHRSLSVSLRQLHSPDAFPVEARGVNYNAPVF